MSAQSLPPSPGVIPYPSPASTHDALESAAESAEPTEPTEPAEAQRRQLLALVPSPGRLVMAGAGLAAIVVGGTVGYWLGRPSPRRPENRLRRTAATIESAIELAPVAMQLLANPIVRSILVRMLLRQISQRAPS